MATFKEVLRQLLRDVRSQKLRTFLTVFGIAGQDSLGSHLSVLAWTGVNAGKTTIQPIDNGTLIVVP